MKRRLGLVLALIIPFLVMALVSFQFYLSGNPLLMKFIGALGGVLVAVGAIGAVVQHEMKSPPTRYQSRNLEGFMKISLLIAAAGAVLIAGVSGVDLFVYGKKLFGMT